jgi:trehalose 6-phosphate phosphatase
MTEAAWPPWPESPALFLDLDGTLVEIVDHPSLTAASPSLRELMPKLPLVCGGAVAVISGRRIEEVDRVLAPHTYLAAGVHGLQRRAHGRAISSIDVGASLASARRKVEPFVAAHGGVWIEDKGLAFAVHYRARPELEPDVHRFVGALQRELPSDVEVLLGNRVFEIKPGVTDKGRAIEAFMEEPPFAGRTPVFIGDDVTDEAGFRSVNALGGVSIKVGTAPTLAVWRLSNVDAVLTWLALAVAGHTAPR